MSDVRCGRHLLQSANRGGWTTVKRLVRNYVPLHHAKVKRIAALLADAWEVPPSQKAAAALRAAGFTADDLWRFGKTNTARLQPDHWRNNTYNDMKDYEIALILRSRLDIRSSHAILQRGRKPNRKARKNPANTANDD